MKRLVSKNTEQEFSKYLAYILRHKPESIGLTMLDFGWVSTDDLISAINKSYDNNYFINKNVLDKIVAEDKKNRYSYKDNDKFIRANQGHSIQGLRMDFVEITPPEYLYHGTSASNLEKILHDGWIKSISRQYVHLSKDIETATQVGKRHGKPVIIKIDCNKAISNGVKFYLSENDVYLSDNLSADTFIIE